MTPDNEKQSPSKTLANQLWALICIDRDPTTNPHDFADTCSACSIVLAFLAHAAVDDSNHEKYANDVKRAILGFLDGADVGDEK